MDQKDLKNWIILHVCGVKDLFELSFWVVKRCARTPLARTTAVIDRFQLYYLVLWTRHGLVGKHQTDSQKIGLKKNKCSVLAERGMECKKSLLDLHGNSKNKVCVFVWKTSYGNNVGLLIMPTVCITVLYQLLVFYWSWMRLLFSPWGILSLTHKNKLIVRTL